jgi:hypothetical protein
VYAGAPEPMRCPISAMYVLEVEVDDQESVVLGVGLTTILFNCPASPTPSELDQFTANLRFGQVLAPCEGLWRSSIFSGVFPFMLLIFAVGDRDVAEDTALVDDSFGKSEQLLP